MLLSLGPLRVRARSSVVSQHMENIMDGEEEETEISVPYELPTYYKWEQHAKFYHPLMAGSIDGTDKLPHDKAIVRATKSKYKPNKKVSSFFGVNFALKSTFWVVGNLPVFIKYINTSFLTSLRTPLFKNPVPKKHSGEIWNFFKKLDESLRPRFTMIATNSYDTKQKSSSIFHRSLDEMKTLFVLFAQKTMIVIFLTNRK